VVKLLAGRHLEGVYNAALRIETRHDTLDRAIFARGVDALQDDPWKGVWGEIRATIGPMHEQVVAGTARARRVGSACRSTRKPHDLGSE
jgi:hypothetical protein